MKAKDLIQRGEKAIVIFTNGIHFRHKDGVGFTGYWAIRHHNSINKVILYQRSSKNKTNLVFVAVPVQWKKYARDGRYSISLTNIECVGETQNDWSTFADTSRNPIRYLP